jgi:hypothetical protein
MLKKAVYKRINVILKHVKAAFIVVKCLVGSNVQWYKISEKCNLN